jgi:hypothetical protein
MDERSGYSGGTSRGSKWGYGVGFLATLLTFGVGMMFEFFGDCPPGAPCHAGEGRRFLMVVALALVLGSVVGLGVRRLVNGPRRVR